MQRYWLCYNGLYLRHQDAFVPHYPRLTNDDPEFVPRHALDAIV